MNAIDRIARRPVFYAGLALVAIQLFLSAPGLEAQMQEQEDRRTERMEERKSQKDMQLADKARAERAQVPVNLKLV